MRQEMVCITCPIGCHLSVESLEGAEIQVSGNRCPRGAVYAREETFSPKRVVTATCRTVRQAAGIEGVSPRESLSAPRRVSCRTTAAFPKESVPELLKAIYALDLNLPIDRGTIVIANALGTGIDVIVTRTIN